MTCNDAYVLIVRTIDDARLSGDERAALRRHLVSCARCRGEYETQHEVRRLLVLHIQDRLPEGFAERLSARLATTSRPLPSGLPGGPPAPSATPRWLEVADVRHRGTRGRTWTLRLIPFAATLALIVAGTSVRDVAPAPAASSSFSGTGPAQSRSFRTIGHPRHDGSTRRHRPSPVSTDVVAQSPAQPTVDDGQPHGTGAVADAGTAVEDAPRTAKEGQRTSDLSDRVPASEPRRQDRERIARGERDASSERDANGERDSGAERAASQQPSVLPRPAAPFPHARPAMPAPPGVIPDRTIPPW